MPILKKFAKKSGVKLGDHALGNITAILTGIEDNVQDRLYKTLRNVRKYWLNISTLFYLNTFSYLIFVY